MKKMKNCIIALLISISFLTSLTHFHNQAMPFRCPPNSEWRLRARWYCKENGGVSVNNYACLYNEIRNMSTETCNFKAHTLQKGYQYIIRHRPIGVECKDRNMYQPFKFTQFSSDCVYLRSKCSEQGLVRFHDGTSAVDKSCRCNFAKGYAFVSKPLQNCYCIPSKEDCSCYIKNCPANYVVSSDYHCIHQKNRSYVANCPDMNPQERFNSNEKTIYRSFHDQSRKDNSPRMIVLVVTAVCTFVIITAQGFLTWFTQTQDPVPPSEIQVEPHNDGLEIKWKLPLYPKSDKIQHFRLEKKVCGITVKTDVLNTLTSHVFNDISPNEYCFQIVTCTKKQGESKRSEMVTFKVSEISPPSELEVISVKSGINLKWSPPVCKSFTHIKEYQIKRIINRQNQYYSTEDTSLLMTDVLPSQALMFTIKTCYLMFNKEFESFSTDICHTTTEISPPSDLEVTPEISGIKVRWSPPTCESYTKIKGYQIKRKINCRVENYETDDTFLVMTDVCPSQVLTFTIKTCYLMFDKEFESVSSEISYTTTEISPPSELEVTPEKSGIKLRWSPPTCESYTKIKKYMIERENNYKTNRFSTDETSLFMTDMSPFQVFTFTIKTCYMMFDQEFKSIPNKISYTTTEATVPNGFGLPVLQFFSNANMQEVSKRKLEKAQVRNVNSFDKRKCIEMLYNLLESEDTQKIQTENKTNYNQRFVNPIPHDKKTKCVMETQEETSDASDMIDQ